MHCRWAMLGVAGILVQVRFVSIVVHHLLLFLGFLPGIGELCPGSYAHDGNSVLLDVNTMNGSVECLTGSVGGVDVLKYDPHAQEILKPDIFWYDAPTKIDLPFNVVGLVLFELVCMHWCGSSSRRRRPCASVHGLPCVRSEFCASCYCWRGCAGLLLACSAR